MDRNSTIPDSLVMRTARLVALMGAVVAVTAASVMGFAGATGNYAIVTR